MNALRQYVRAPQQAVEALADKPQQPHAQGGQDLRLDEQLPEQADARGEDEPQRAAASERRQPEPHVRAPCVAAARRWAREPLGSSAELASHWDHFQRTASESFLVRSTGRSF